MIRIILFGSSKHSISVLQSLLDIPEYKVVAVVTQPDKPTGRKHILTPTPVKTLALRHNLEVLTPSDLKSTSFITKIKNLKVNLLIVADYRLLIPKEILDISKHGGLNLHPSLLPKYRGSSPAQWAILRGEKISGMTVIKMSEEFDKGKIVAQKIIPLTPTETSESFYQKAFNEGAELLKKILPNYLKGKLELKEQESGEYEYARRLKGGNGKIDWNLPDEKIERLIRAFYPWPGTWTTLGELTKRYKKIKIKRDRENRVKILKAHLDENKELVIDELQMEGKKTVNWEEFERGYLAVEKP